MFAIASNLILLLAAVILASLGRTRVRASIYWLAAVIAALIAWALLLLARSNIPQEIQLAQWLPSTIFLASPSLLVDQISWTFGLSLATLALAAILTDTARTTSADQPVPDRYTWISILVVTTLGILTVFSSNLLTLLITWTALDLAGMIIWLLSAQDRTQSESVVIAFSVQVAGILGVIWASAAAHANGLPLDLLAITPQTTTGLLLAAGLRLGVLPVNSSLPRDIPKQRSLNIMLRMTSAASSLVLVVRCANSGSPITNIPFLLALAIIAGLYGGIHWASADSEIDGRDGWIIGMAALSISAAVLAKPEVSLSWALALLFSGSLILLANVRNRWLSLFLLFGAVNISSLPYTPTWSGTLLFSGRLTLFTLSFLLPQGLLLAGYIRHVLGRAKQQADADRWLWIIYPWGLILLPLVHLVITRLSKPTSISLTQSWPGLVIVVLSSAIIILVNRFQARKPRWIKGLDRILSGNWLYGILWRLYHQLRKLSTNINQVLEGRAGILWALLLLTILLSILTQVGRS